MRRQTAIFWRYSSKGSLSEKLGEKIHISALWKKSCRWPFFVRGRDDISKSDMASFFPARDIMHATRTLVGGFMYRLLVKVGIHQLPHSSSREVTCLTAAAVSYPVNCLLAATISGSSYHMYLLSVCGYRFWCRLLLKVCEVAILRHHVRACALRRDFGGTQMDVVCNNCSSPAPYRTK